MALLGVVSGYCSNEGTFVTDGTLEFRVTESAPASAALTEMIDECLYKAGELLKESHRLKQHFLPRADLTKLNWAPPPLDAPIAEKLSALLEEINASLDMVLTFH
ncbi:MAG: hypothetical protein LBJ89_02875 [Holosporales bacterium]|nr:hypothetical protein [Holosporales bacterium]